MKHIASFLIIICCNILYSWVDIYNKWHNPLGWKIPDFNKLQLIDENRQVKLIPGQVILIQKYLVKNNHKPYIEYDKKIDFKEKSVELHCGIEREIHSVIIYKTIKEKILLYEITAIFIEKYVYQQKKDEIAEVTYAMKYFLTDLNDDGIYETRYGVGFRVENEQTAIQMALKKTLYEQSNVKNQQKR